MRWTHGERDLLAGLGILLLCLMGLLGIASSPWVQAVQSVEESAAEAWTEQLALARRVFVNTADAETLQRLPGIGEALAVRLIETRNAHGPFRQVEDLERVPGIGPAKRQALEAYISVELD